MPQEDSRGSSQDADDLPTETSTLSRRAWLGYFAGLAIVCLVTHIPYLSEIHVWDDLRHLYSIGEVQVGRLEFGTFLCRFHNEHFIALWKGWYWFCLESFGLNPYPWHLSIFLFQYVGALSLVGIARGCGASHPMALASGVLWAGASFGNFDNPLLWIAASHLSMAATFVLLAGFCSQARAPDWLALLGVFVMMMLSIATMTSILVFSALVPALAILQRKQLTAMRWRGVLVVWGACAVLALAIQFWGMSYQGFEATASIEERDSSRIVPSFLAVQGSALARLLVGFSAASVELSIGLALLAGSSFWLVERRARGFVLAIAFGALAHTALVAIARSEFPSERFQVMGRFTYLPTLAMGVLLAGSYAWMQSSLFKLNRSRQIAVGGVAACLFVGTQLIQSYAAVELAAKVNRESYQPWQANQVVAMQLAKHSDRVPIPDFPIPLRSFDQPLSGFLAYTFDETRSEGETVKLLKLYTKPPADMSPEDWQQLESALRGVERSYATHAILWFQSLQSVMQYRPFFQALAAESELTVLPEIGIASPATRRLTLESALRYSAPELASNFRFVARSEMKAGEVEKTLAVLDSVDEPFAQEFAALLRQDSSN